MSTTSLQIKSIPERGSGVLVTKNTTAWAMGEWKQISPRTQYAMSIIAVAFQDTVIVGNDATDEGILEIGYGQAGYEQTRVQIPTSVRADTNVGYYMPFRFPLPEPVEVPIGTRISVRRAAQGSGGGISVPMKLIVMMNDIPLQNADVVNVENFKNIKVGSGMSVTERGF